jgi:hypothetical protein
MTLLSGDARIKPGVSPTHASKNNEDITPMNTDTGKILIGLSLIMVSVAMIISPSNAAVPGASCNPCPMDMAFTQDSGAYPGSADGSGVIAHAPVLTGNRPDQSTSP